MNHSLSKLTILSTCYNKRDFLEQFINLCEQCILAGARIVIVNDGSTDTSGEVLEFLAEGLDEITLIHSENKGSAAARNLALENVNSEFFMYCDIDDLVDIETLIDAVQRMSTNNLDLFVGNYVIYPKSALHLAPKINQSQSEKRRRNDLFDGLGYWRCIYRTSTLKEAKIRFLPTFDELGSQYFILDDIYWMLQLSALDLRIESATNEKVLYKYHRDLNITALEWEKYLRQVVLMPIANSILMSEIRKNPKLDREWIVSKSDAVLYNHLKYLNLSMGLKTLAPLRLYFSKYRDLRPDEKPQMRVKQFMLLIYFFTKNSANVRRRLESIRGKG
jgi:glycosyltransferase involved in cell wall biosynthesis